MGAVIVFLRAREHKDVFPTLVSVLGDHRAWGVPQQRRGRGVRGITLQPAYVNPLSKRLPKKF
jgi:hypothetical protein